MSETTTVAVNTPVWIELSSTDQKAGQEFYSKLFGWDIEIAKEPEAGGYGLAKIDGKFVAGVGGKMPGDPSPSSWNVYIGATDADAIAKKVEAAGGKVVAPPFDVLKSGRMAVFQDPIGAFIHVWQANEMPGFDIKEKPGTFSWAELNARGLDKAKPFYTNVFGWAVKESPMGEGADPYTEWQIDGKSIGGAMEMVDMVPAEVPSYWLVYFDSADVDQSYEKAKELGATTIVEPRDFPGGRFALVSDPQGAVFGIVKSSMPSA